MQVNKVNLSVKKRLMFSKEEDYYFVTYNVLIFLNTLACMDFRTRFYDYTKLSYVIPFVSNNTLLNLIVKYNNTDRGPSQEEREILQETYLKSRLKLKLLTSILFTLEHNGLVTLHKESGKKTIDIWLNKEKLPTDFLNATLFKIEEENSRSLKTLYPQIRTLTSKTLLQKFYTNKGVRVWET